jgi:AI-2 transport protein TqsA
MINSHNGPADRRVQSVCLLILTLIAVAVALAFLQPVLVPFVLAIFFSQCLTPPIDYLMQRFRWPQMVAVSIAAIAAAAIMVGVGFLLTASVSGMSPGDLDDYRLHFQTSANSMLQSRAAHWLGLSQGSDNKSLLNVGILSEKGVDLFAFVAALIGTILKNTATVLILMAFLLFGRRRAVRSDHGILAEIEIRVQRYISLTVAISILTGLMVGVSLAILGVQFAAGFGFLAFLLNFIPNLGAVVATLLPLPIAFLDPHLSLVAKFLALAIPSAVQVGIGSFVQPRMMGHSLELHPVVLLLSLLFFTMIWGLGGAFLATPLTAVIKIIFEKIPATRPLAALLAGNLDPLAESIDATDTMEDEDPPMPGNKVA